MDEYDTSKLMNEICDNQCENCIHADHGYDEYSHMCCWMSDRCPVHSNRKLYHDVNKRFLPVEMITTWIGCRFFVRDEEYTKQCEETESLIKEMNEKWRKKNEIPKN